MPRAGSRSISRSPTTGQVGSPSGGPMVTTLLAGNGSKPWPTTAAISPGYRRVSA